MGGDPHEFVPSERIGPEEVLTVRRIGAVLAAGPQEAAGEAPGTRAAVITDARRGRRSDDERA